MSKHHKMKQSVRYFLTMILCLCMLAGCGSRDTAQTLQTGNAAAEYHTEIVETDKNESTAEQTLSRRLYIRRRFGYATWKY